MSPDGPTAERCFTDRFESWSQRTPEAPAVEFLKQRLSYGELDTRANQLAHGLVRRGVGPEVHVGICVDRSLEMVVGILGILKAGGAFVPLDPNYPAERLRFMLEDSAPRLLLTQPHLRDTLPGKIPQLVLDPDWEAIAAERADRPRGSPALDSLAYTIYTSGSTGRPKGVLIEHRGLSHIADFERDHLDGGPGTRVAQLASLSFDATMLEMIWSLALGGTLVMAPREQMLPGPGLHQLLSERSVSHAFMTPSAVAALPTRPLPELRTLAIGGEVCSAELVARWSAGRHLVNLYGPTECSILTSFFDCAEPDGPPPIGRAFAGRTMRVLDDGLNPLPAGAVGELHVSGPGLARGYLNRTDLTAQMFVADPHSDPPGARLYKTGDLARAREDGQIEFVGRVDHQVKIRGQRIELGEIESVLMEHAGVRDCVVTARTGEGPHRLVAYFVLRAPGGASVAALRSHLSEKLPQHMVPAFFVALDTLPLTPNAKVDRDALPEPDTARPQLHQGYVAPDTPTQQSLARIWAEVLELDEVGVHDDFFELGGHSLIAVQAISRVRDEFGIELPIRDLYEFNTVAGIARRLDGAARAATPFPDIGQADRNAELPLSFSQQRVWFLQHLHPDSAAYHFGATLRLTGQLDVTALTRSLDAIVERHEILRTAFPAVEGRPIQVVHPHRPIDVPSVDLTAHDATRAAEEFEALLEREFSRPFDLARPDPIRWTLVRMQPDEHVLIQIEHHLVHDGWSLPVLLRELVLQYNARAAGDDPGLETPRVQFADFATWQQGWIRGPIGRAQLEYWKQQLKDCPAVSSFPADRPRPAALTLKGASIATDLPLPLCEALRALGRETGVSLYMLMLSGFFALLQRYSGQNDLCVGAGIANRRWKEIEDLLGMVINTLALRTDLSDDPSFRDLVYRVRDMCLNAYEHQDAPFGQVVDAASPPRSASHTPLYQVMFSFHDSPMPALEFDGLESEFTEGISFDVAKFDLNVIVIPRSEQRVGERSDARDPRMKLIWEYNSDLFDASTMQRILGHYQRLLEAIVAQPDQSISGLALLSAAERKHILETGSATNTPYPRDSSIQELFATQVERAPDAVALSCGSEQLTYAALERRANQLAHHLAELGVGSEMPVGVCLERSIDAVVALLAVLKAGGAYVPLDPEYPTGRLGFMIEDCRLRVLITTGALRKHTGASSARVVCIDTERADILARPSDPLRVESAGHSLAYVMYTSGSTGRPKGVCVEHHNVVRLVRNTDYVSLDADEVLLQLAPISFDAATFEIWGALLNGARLAILPERRFSLHGLGEVVQRERVSTLWLTAPLFHQMVNDEISGLRGVRQLLAGGDVLSADHVRRALDALEGCTVINGYGPTEGTTFSCCHRMTAECDLRGSVPIGRPIANTRVYIVDVNFEPCPVGVAGELLIGGDGLARAYQGAPELTAARFVADPFSTVPGERLYRSGDLARFNARGEIEFLGRIDSQVKVRGFRVEPGEVEAALSQHPDIESAVVVVQAPAGSDDTASEKRLVAYAVPIAATDLDGSALIAFLKHSLPDYMLPTAIIPVQRLPLTPSGKLDRASLPAWRPETTRHSSAPAPPRNPVETALAQIWRDVLRIEKVGIFDNFFDLGGHSLLATQMAARILDEFDVAIALNDLFRGPTIAELANVLEAAPKRGENSDTQHATLTRRDRSRRERKP
jgi:amino acid adenylation domain-containing protein